MENKVPKSKKSKNVLQIDTQPEAVPVESEAVPIEPEAVPVESVVESTAEPAAEPEDIAPTFSITFSD